MTDLIIAQISDLHIRCEGKLLCDRVDTAAMLRRCVEHLASLPMRPSMLLATGDLTDGGTPAEYQTLKALLAPLQLPVYLIPGNHDDRDALREGFADHPWLAQSRPFVHYAIEDWPLRIVALDTSVPGCEGGQLCADRLAWLEATLAAEPAKSTLVMMHHPPFRTWMAGMDAIGLEAPEPFCAVIARHPQVERIVCGHLHRHIEARIGRVPVSVCPGAAHQIALDLAPGSPARFSLEPPGYLLHLWRAGEGMVTHSVPVGSFPGPYEFG